MKKLLVLTLLLACSPTYAMVEFCNSNTCIDFGEEDVQSIETTTRPTYGVNIIRKGGRVVFFAGDSKSDALSSFQNGYLSLQEYYNWSDSYYYNVLKRQDKAGLGQYQWLKNTDVVVV